MIYKIAGDVLIFLKSALLNLGTASRTLYGSLLVVSLSLRNDSGKDRELGSYGTMEGVLDPVWLGGRGVAGLIVYISTCSETYWEKIILSVMAVTRMRKRYSRLSRASNNTHLV